MTFKRILFILSLLSIALIVFEFTSHEDSKTTNESTIETNFEDTKPPSIDFLSPSKCQEYIISKPNIKIKYSDESNIDIDSIKLFVNYKDVTKDALISEKEISYTPTNKLRRGSQIVKLQLGDLSPNKNATSLQWYFVVGTPIYNHYRGLLHAHTSISDGKGSFSDAYYLARDKANLDFFALTEHSNHLDNANDCFINDASNSTKWMESIKYKDMFTSKGDFIALNGFEMTYPSNKENPIGHINIFNSKGFVTPNHDDMELNNFYNLIYKQDDIIGQFNHPSVKLCNFDKFKYSSKGDEIISLIEVGNGCNEDMNKNLIAFDMYQLALDNGWHLAPTCNQDNHKVNFGIANEFRTVILATDLNEDALYDAMRNMRVYATQDKNIKIEYTVNDLPMGSTIKNSPKLNFNISAIDSDADNNIEQIQVISNDGEIIKSKNFNSNLTKLDFRIKSKKNTFYYVKVIQKNNKISVTAPIWVK